MLEKRESIGFTHIIEAYFMYIGATIAPEAVGTHCIFIGKSVYSVLYSKFRASWGTV